jgi:histone H3/H4
MGKGDTMTCNCCPASPVKRLARPWCSALPSPVATQSRMAFCSQRWSAALVACGLSSAARYISWLCSIRRKARLLACHHGRTFVQKNHAYRQILQYGQRCIQQQCLGTVQASVVQMRSAGAA